MSNVPPPPPPMQSPPPPGDPAQPQSAAAYDPAPTTPVAMPIETVAAAGPSNLKIFAAEIVGTFVLMMVGPGTAILAADTMGTLGIALAFGLALLAMAYTIGHVSGCHINPAVTLAFFISRKITLVQAGVLLGRPGGRCDPRRAAAVHHLRAAATTTRPVCSPPTAGAATSTCRSGSGPAIGVEIFFTALLIFVVLSTTTKGYPVGFGGLAVGLTLAMIHLATIPVDNTSVNPARSIGTAIFGGGDAMKQLWVFIIFPLVGAVLGLLVWLLVHDEDLESTVFGSQPGLVAARDKAAGMANQVQDRFQ